MKIGCYVSILFQLALECFKSFVYKKKLTNYHHKSQWIAQEDYFGKRFWHVRYHPSNKYNSGQNSRTK